MFTGMQISSVNFGAKISAIPRIKGIKSDKVKLDNLNLNGYTAFIGADVYAQSNRIVKQDLLFKDKSLYAIDDFDEKTIKDKIQYVILENKTITPGLLDEHIHGGYGVNFHNSNEDEIRGLLRKLGSEGTAGVVATTLPGKTEDIKKQIKVLSNIINNPQEGEAKVYGIHLEGPFLSPYRAGIHPKEMLAKPNIDNYLALEPENVKIVTLAPEEDEGVELAKYLKKNRVIPSAGHSKASEADIINAGIKQVTHIFNAMIPLHQRDMNVLSEALWNKNIAVEMNSDQSLLAPKIMDIIMRLKPKNKILLISDALPEAGIKKDFIMNGTTIRVKDDWTAISDNGILAGSMQFLHNVAKKIVSTTQMTFTDFIRFASVNPSHNIHVQKDFQLKEGLSPNFSIWDNNTLKVEKTFIK